MAERRMFTKIVTDDDNFMALSSSAQALYLHLSMGADDDGFCNQVSASMFKAHASVQDLQALLEKRYIYQFENGVIVIKHWRMANALRKDRYSPTNFREELSRLNLKANGAYEWLPNGCQMVAKWLPNGCQMVAERLPQDRLDKNSIGKVSIDKVSIDKNNTPSISPSTSEICPPQKNATEEKSKRFIAPTLSEVQAYCAERGNNVDAQRFIDYYTSNGWVVGKNKMKDWKAAVRTWERSSFTHTQPKIENQKELNSFEGPAPKDDLINSWEARLKAMGRNPKK